MGRDKAGVLVEGRPLWERQIATLRAVDPAKLFISGKSEGPYSGAGVEIVPDITPACGPLSGLEAALHHALHDLVLVLAIDLPAITAGFLSGLMSLAGEKQMGVVPRYGEWFEPLAAVYSRRCLPLIEASLRSGDYAMRTFLLRAMEERLIVVRPLANEEMPLFRNVNTPADL